MRAPRRWAHRLLSWSARTTPDEIRDWAAAMLHELEAVEGDWESLWWALGGASALVRYAARMMAFRQLRHIEEWRHTVMEQFGRKAGWLVVGALGTVALSLAALGLQFGGAELFPQLGLRSSMWIHLIMVLFIPLAIALTFAAWIWRRKRPVALGILLSAVVMSGHVAIYFALHARH
jgi:hypothetical protein